MSILGDYFFPLTICVVKTTNNHILQLRSHLCTSACDIESDVVEYAPLEKSYTVEKWEILKKSQCTGLRPKHR